MKESGDPMPFEEVHAALGRDIQLLGEILGEVIRQQVGEDIYGLVERVRSLAKAGRSGDAEARAALEATLAGLSTHEMHWVARSFAHFLTLSNIAEQQHRIRRRRQYQAANAGSPQRGSTDESLGRLVKAGVATADIAACVANLEIELVLTAHPTEVRRRTVQRQHRQIAQLLRVRDLHDMTRREEALNRDELARVVGAIWATEEVRKQKPTPEDEVRGGLAVIEQVKTEPGEVDGASSSQGAVGGCRARVDLDDPVISGFFSENQVDSDESPGLREAGDGVDGEPDGSLRKTRSGQGNAAPEVAEPPVIGETLSTGLQRNDRTAAGNTEHARCHSLYEGGGDQLFAAGLLRVLRGEGRDLEGAGSEARLENDSSARASAGFELSAG